MSCTASAHDAVMKWPPGNPATEQARRFLELVATETKQAQLMKRAGMVGVPPKHGAIKLFRRRRISLALKRQRLIERRVARRLVQIGAPENRDVSVPCLTI